MHYYLLIVSNNDVPMISYRQFSKELILSAVLMYVEVVNQC